MSEQSSTQPPSRPRSEAVSQPPVEYERQLMSDAADQAVGVRLMVAGAVVAVLAPLAGFLVGSMIGPSSDPQALDAMFLSMFVGLVVGGAGAVVGILGLLRWIAGAGGG